MLEHLGSHLGDASDRRQDGIPRPSTERNDADAALPRHRRERVVSFARMHQKRVEGIVELPDAEYGQRRGIGEEPEVADMPVLSSRLKALECTGNLKLFERTPDSYKVEVDAFPAEATQRLEQVGLDEVGGLGRIASAADVVPSDGQQRGFEWVIPKRSAPNRRQHREIQGDPGV